MRKISLWAVVFLVILRLTIGWQFLMEGLQKVRSNYLIGPSETSKPFSSEGYFRGSTGPFSSLIKGQLPDPDEQLLAYTLLQPLPEGAKVEALSPGERMPVALGAMWDNYRRDFVGFYRLSSDQAKIAEQKVEQARANYVKWLATESQEVTRKVSGKDVPRVVTVQNLVEEYKTALKEYREFDRKRWVLFREVDKEDYALARSKVIELRTALTRDVEKKTDEMRGELAKVVRLKADDSLVLPKLDADLEEALPKLLKLGAKREGDSLSAAIPIELDKKWQEYSTSLMEALKVEDDRQKKLAERLLDRSREQTVLWMLDLNVQGPKAGALVGVLAGDGPASGFQGIATALAWAHCPPGPADQIAKLLEPANATTDELKALRQSLAKDLEAQTKRMKDGQEEMLTETQKAVTLPKGPEGWSFIKTLDFITILLITVAGAMLLVGFFTRTACILAAGFLLLTFLSAPPFPWLPLPPGTEGNPIYVNKNLIELMALLALAGTASGRWAGLDGLIAWFAGKDDDDEDPDGQARPGPASSAPPPRPVPVVQVKQKPKV